MADLPSTNSKIQIEETTYRAPVSETLTQRMGGSINYALDQVAANATAISNETAARIAADAANYSALDGRLNALTYWLPSGFTVNSGTLSAGNDTASYTLTGNRQHWVTVIMEPNDPTEAAGRVAVYINGTAFAGQVMNYWEMDEPVQFYNATGINGGMTSSFYVATNTAAFGDPVTIVIRSWNTQTSIDFKIIRSSITVTTGA